ncbi:MAG: metabolite traffic protein EboE, partial [Cyclobacteriaceae bacterium]
ERADYTNRLFNILAQLVPENVGGGISTSPLSYKHWHSTIAQKQKVYQKSTEHLAQVVAELIKIKEATSISMHLDIEPEPDGMLENSSEVLDYFSQWLLPVGTKHLQEGLGISIQQAEAAVREHIQLCYDVCHFAVAYEDHQEAIDRFAEEGWQIGKIQISAALKADLPADHKERQLVKEAFEQFNESTYLHQVVARDQERLLTQYPDLEEALADFDHPGNAEWRTHFHVPIFLPAYQALQSTQDDIKRVLEIWQNKPFSQHLEVETYTWEVLPPTMQTDLASSIERELRWVMDQLD